MNFEVERIGKCIICGQDSIISLGEFEAETEQEAINKALEEWGYDNFGQAGALRENDQTKEEMFLNAKFIAIEIK